MRAVTYAPEAWKSLNGIFCVYKPSEYFTPVLRRSLKVNLCKDLNAMETRPVQSRVEIRGSIVSGQPFSVEMVPNYADHVLVSGPRYQDQDIRLFSISSLGKYTSGVLPLAINDECGRHLYGMNSYLRKYEVKGLFGKASSNYMADGKIRMRSTYSHIRQKSLDTLLSSIQLSHQALAFQYAGVDMNSQVAYDLASKGTVRPSTKSRTLLYGLKCIDFNLPEFTLEINCIHETEEYLGELIHEIGVFLKSCALCTQLRRTQFGPFTLDHALLRKHWNLESVLNNITLCRSILGDNYLPSSSHFKPVSTAKLKEVLKDQQDKARNFDL